MYKTNLIVFKFPKNYPYSQKQSFDTILRVENGFAEFFGVKIGRFQLKRSLTMANLNYAEGHQVIWDTLYIDQQSCY